MSYASTAECFTGMSSTFSYLSSVLEVRFPLPIRNVSGAQGLWNISPQLKQRVGLASLPGNSSVRNALLQIDA